MELPHIACSTNRKITSNYPASSCLLHKMSSNNLMGNEDGVANNAPSKIEYEVFLSFRGSDTRFGFTDHLYCDLADAGIKAYKDDEELRFGEEIGPELLRSINQSKIAIPIFSQGYAASKWCLKELACIMHCTRSMGLKVMPIFYDVTPSEVRNQTGAYGEAFRSHEKYYDETTVQEWKEALRQAGKLKGWDMQSDNNRRQGKLVKEITTVVLRELKKAYTVVTDYLIGVDHHVEEILNMIKAETAGVRIVGIYGMGGIGKTTLAKVIYNRLVSDYENHSFLADIGHNHQSGGMVFLQKRLIFDITRRESADIANEDEGAEVIGRVLSNKKVLILLDDVDNVVQFQRLMRRYDSFSSGSNIIVTTRNKGILDAIGADWSYELNCVDSHQALQLFSKYAFGEDKPPKEYAVLSQRAVDITGGLPLAIEVIGSLLCGKKNELWEIILRKFEKFPNEEVGRKLRNSILALDDQQKQIFLDIACFFIGADVRNVIHFWDDELNSEEAMEVLQQMSIIKIKKDNSIWMHDQMRDVGRDIVRQEHVEPEKRSRLWEREQATKIFKGKMGHRNVRGVSLDLLGQSVFPHEEFAQLPNLRLLHLIGPISWRNVNGLTYNPPILSKLRWLSCARFPPCVIENLSLENLVILDLPWSDMENSWSGWGFIKMAKELKVLHLKACNRLVKTPDFSSHLLLRILVLEGCSELVEIDASISMLRHLIVINLKDCCRLCKLPEELSCYDSLEELIIDGTSISEVPNWPGMKRLMVFSATGCSKLEKLNSFNFAKCISKLSLASCNSIKTLPKTIGDMVSLTELDISYSGIIFLPNTMGYLKNLKSLSLVETPITELPTTIRMMENLQRIDLRGCSIDMVELPEFPPSLTLLRASSVRVSRIPNLAYLIHLKDLELCIEIDRRYEGCNFERWGIGRLIDLQVLSLGFSYMTTLPTSLGALSQLKELNLGSCNNLRGISTLPSSLTSLSVHECSSLDTILDLPSRLEVLAFIDCRSLGQSLDLSNARKLARLTICRTPVSKLEGLHCCKSMQELTLDGCKFSDISGLEMLESLTTLKIHKCEKLQRLPDVSNLKMLNTLNVEFCPNLVEIPGKLGSLDSFYISDCTCLVTMPKVASLRLLRHNLPSEVIRKFLSDLRRDTLLPQL